MARNEQGSVFNKYIQGGCFRRPSAKATSGYAEVLTQWHRCNSGFSCHATGQVTFTAHENTVSCRAGKLTCCVHFEYANRYGVSYFNYLSIQIN